MRIAGYDPQVLGFGMSCIDHVIAAFRDEDTGNLKQETLA
jgi:hypothetical protein